ncbi:hypothetical protein CC86DRAFT_408131 [Ophiobolus disseminans]|uniref:Uncharacterized protein n=1 Tax=Ophiobolus disseminans TaxID=1469910 RepID=A0A6A6ZVA0_9PLEO|nr:hypothetical protein CC86DRAFT_408131 [Ophiobolus disseminans]
MASASSSVLPNLRPKHDDTMFHSSTGHIEKMLNAIAQDIFHHPTELNFHESKWQNSLERWANRADVQDHKKNLFKLYASTTLGWKDMDCSLDINGCKNMPSPEYIRRHFPTDPARAREAIYTLEAFRKLYFELGTYKQVLHAAKDDLNKHCDEFSRNFFYVATKGEKKMCVARIVQIFVGVLTGILMIIVRYAVPLSMTLFECLTLQTPHIIILISSPCLHIFARNILVLALMLTGAAVLVGEPMSGEAGIGAIAGAAASGALAAKAEAGVELGVGLGIEAGIEAIEAPIVAGVMEGLVETSAEGLTLTTEATFEGFEMFHRAASSAGETIGSSAGSVGESAASDVASSLFGSTSESSGVTWTSSALDFAVDESLLFSTDVTGILDSDWWKFEALSSLTFDQLVASATAAAHNFVHFPRATMLMWRVVIQHRAAQLRSLGNGAVARRSEAEYVPTDKEFDALVEDLKNDMVDSWLAHSEKAKGVKNVTAYVEQAKSRIQKESRFNLFCSSNAIQNQPITKTALNINSPYSFGSRIAMRMQQEDGQAMDAEQSMKFWETHSAEIDRRVQLLRKVPGQEKFNSTDAHNPAKPSVFQYVPIKVPTTPLKIGVNVAFDTLSWDSILGTVIFKGVTSPNPEAPELRWRTKPSAKLTSNICKRDAHSAIERLAAKNIHGKLNALESIGLIQTPKITKTGKRDMTLNSRRTGHDRRQSQNNNGNGDMFVAQISAHLFKNPIHFEVCGTDSYTGTTFENKENCRRYSTYVSMSADQLTLRKSKLKEKLHDNLKNSLVSKAYADQNCFLKCMPSKSLGTTRREGLYSGNVLGIKDQVRCTSGCYDTLTGTFNELYGSNGDPRAKKSVGPVTGSVWKLDKYRINNASWLAYRDRNPSGYLPGRVDLDPYHENLKDHTPILPDDYYADVLCNCGDKYGNETLVVSAVTNWHSRIGRKEEGGDVRACFNRLKDLARKEPAAFLLNMCKIVYQELTPHNSGSYTEKKNRGGYIENFINCLRYQE